ncbi:MAG: hypothetical protein ACOC5L_03185 [Halobacteriota archaeon]
MFSDRLEFDTPSEVTEAVRIVIPFNIKKGEAKNTNHGLAKTIEDLSDFELTVLENFSVQKSFKKMSDDLDADLTSINDTVEYLKNKGYII